MKQIPLQSSMVTQVKRKREEESIRKDSIATNKAKILKDNSKTSDLEYLDEEIIEDI